MGEGRLDYRLLFEEGPEAMLVLAADGRVLDASREARKSLWRRQDDFLRAQNEGVFDPGDSRTEDAFAELEWSGRFEGELRLLRSGRPPLSTGVLMVGFGEGLISVILQDATDHGRRAREEVRRLTENLEDRVAERTAQLAAIVAKLSTSERMLRESEERFRITFDQAAVGIAHVAPDGHWLRANQRLCEIVGYPREELLEKSFQDITHADDLDADLEQARKMLSGELETYSKEKRYLRRDGREIWVTLAVTLVCAEDGDPDYFISVIEDIDRRKRAEERLQSLTAREVAALKLLARGCMNKEIADRLNFSVSSAKTHVQRVLTKLGVSGRAEAAAQAVELGLVEAEE